MSKMLEKENGNVTLRVILFMGDKIAKGETPRKVLLLPPNPPSNPTPLLIIRQLNRTLKNAYHEN